MRSLSARRYSWTMEDEDLKGLVFRLYLWTEDRVDLFDDVEKTYPSEVQRRTPAHPVYVICIIREICSKNIEKLPLIRDLQIFSCSSSCPANISRILEKLR